MCAALQLFPLRAEGGSFPGMLSAAEGGDEVKIPEWLTFCSVLGAMLGILALIAAYAAIVCFGRFMGCMQPGPLMGGMVFTALTVLLGVGSIQFLEIG